MHELSVTQNIIKICLRESEKNGAKKINIINIKVGELTGLVPDYISEYFKVVSRGTIAEFAEVNVEKIPVSIICEGCGFEGEIEQGHYNCPSCSGSKYKITNGRDFYVDSIEVD